jgi:ligand-binding sensor domain-containing protein
MGRTLRGRLLHALLAAISIASLSCGRTDLDPDPTTAGLPDGVQNTQVNVTGEWVNFVNADKVRAILDGPDDVWFGTSGGLVRYQKSSGEWHYYDHGNSGLPCNDVWSLALDRAGGVWIGTRHNGLVRFDGENWLPLPILGQNGYSPPVSGLYFDPQGTLWAATSGLLYEFDGTNWTSYDFIDRFSSSEVFEGTVSDQEGQLWIATSSKIGVLDQATDTLDVDTSLPLRGEIQTLTIDHAGGIWLGLTQGVAHRKAGTWTVYDMSNSGLPSGKVYAISADPSGAMWFGTGAGLGHFLDQEWQTYLIPDLQLADQSIFSVASSSNGTTWVGTYRQGLYRLNDGEFVHESTNASGYPGTNAYALAEDATGAIWVGMSEGLARWQHGQWTLFDSTNSPLPSSVVSIAPDIDGKALWLGTPKGLVKFQGDNWVTYDSTNSGLPSSYVNDVLVDHSGRVWVATTAGLAVSDGANWQTFTRSNSSVPNDRPRSLALDSQGDLWIGFAEDWVTSNGASSSVPGGLALYDGQTFKVFTTKNSGIPSDYVLDVAVDEQKVVWLATISTGTCGGPACPAAEGLVRFDGATWKLFNSANSPLPDDYAQSVSSDGKGCVWVGTSQGLARYDGAQWQVWHHNDSGLSDEDVWDVLVDHRGNTWIGTSLEGLSVYKPGGVEFDR